MTRASRRSSSRIVAPSSLALLVLAAACGHSDAFTTPNPHSSGPFSTGVPVRLTLAATPDLDPAWLPGGASLAYSYQRPESAEGDWCIGYLPVVGGAIAREVCDYGLHQADSTTILGAPAISASGYIAYQRSASARFGGLVNRAVVFAPVDNPLATQVARTIPFSGPDGLYVSIGRHAWIGLDDLAFPGIVEAVVTPCPGCDPFVVAYPRNLLRVSVSNRDAVTVIPHTDYATSVSGGESSDVIYYTLADDSRIYHQTLSTGEVRVVHDFGTAGIARDVHYSNGRIAVIVGGSVTVIHDVAGPLQLSGPGRLLIVDPGLAEATEPDPRPDFMYTSPALSETGEGLAAVQFSVSVNLDPITGLPLSVEVVSSGDVVRFGAD